MSCSDLKKMHVPCTGESNLFREEYNINVLNNDCLLHIFEFLPIKEKLLIEFVCKRWNALCIDSLHYLWKSTTSLIIDDCFKYKNLQGNEKQNTAFLKQILQRCGDYLNKLLIDDMHQVKKVNWSDVIKKCFVWCNNLTVLDLRFIENLDDQDYRGLYAMNKNLKIISLRDVEINAFSLLILNQNKIEEFQLSHCKIHNVNYLFNFLTKLKNLKVLKLDFLESYEDYDELLYALNDKNIDTLTEISFKYFEIPFDIEKLAEFLVRQKKLRKIRLDEIPEGLIDTVLSMKNLEEIEDIVFEDDFVNALERFTNLKSLSGYKAKMSEEYLQKISKCKSLQKLALEMFSPSLTTVGVNYLINLENLTNLTISIREPGHEPHCKSLLALSKCKKLKSLKIIGMNFEEDEELENFSNLVEFHIYNSNITLKILCNILKKSSKTTYILIQQCPILFDVLVDSSEDLNLVQLTDNALELRF